MNDNQRSKVYGAEGVLSKYKSKTGEKIFGDAPTTKQCKAYMEKVVSYEWFTARWHISTPSYVEGNSPIVGDGQGRRKACWQASSYEIKLPHWARTEAVILHEMAHWIVDVAKVPPRDGSVRFWETQYPANHAAHGVEFAAVLLELVRLQLGADAAKALKASYKARRVKRDKQPQPIHRKAQQVA